MPAQLTRRRDRGWYDDGPLGNRNYRKQLGRSDELGDPVQKDRAMLVMAGATQHTDDPSLDGLARRAEGDAAASLIQVTCTYAIRAAGAGTRPLSVRGKISWGTDGHAAEASFDWLNGTVIQVAASYVSVVAELVDTRAVGDEEASHDPLAVVTVGALVGYWSGNRLPPTLTQQLFLPAEVPAAEASIEIPRFARRLWWTGPVPSSAVWALGPGAGQTIAQVDPAGITQTQGYERPGIATHLQIVGNAGATLNNLVWELVL